MAYLDGVKIDEPKLNIKDYLKKFKSAIEKTPNVIVTWTYSDIPDNINNSYKDTASALLLMLGQIGVDIKHVEISHDYGVIIFKTFEKVFYYTGRQLTE